MWSFLEASAEGGFDASESRTPKARKDIVSSILTEVFGGIYGTFL